MEKKKNGLLRPVSWLAVFAMMCFSSMIAGWLCDLGVWLRSFLREMTNFQVAICFFLFGGTYSGLVIYAVALVPGLIVSLGDMIYPSNHAFRYYFFGVWFIVGSVIIIVCAILGFVSGGPMFWLYAEQIYMIVQCVITMILARQKANERHKEEILT